jgi:hypothetical protein
LNGFKAFDHQWDSIIMTAMRIITIKMAATERAIHNFLLLSVFRIDKGTVQGPRDDYPGVCRNSRDRRETQLFYVWINH